jgi:uncharacterized protein YodC (DUF2158 family)
MEAIKAGDVVLLKSGSPLMVVEEVTGDNASCHWMSADKNFVARADLNIVLLKRADSVKGAA